MVIDASKLTLFDELVELTIEGVYYDLHNEFTCINITYSNNTLGFAFDNHSTDLQITFSFTNCELTKADASLILHDGDLTLNQVYRGRFEMDGRLHDLSADGRAYMYVSFVEDHELEFFCDKIEIKKIEK